jgi:hypothetical protein
MAPSPSACWFTAKLLQRLTLYNVYITPATPENPPNSTIACGMIAGSYVVGSPGACGNFTFNMASQVQVKKAGDPDANYRNIWAYIPGSGSPSPQDGLIY